MSNQRSDPPPLTNSIPPAAGADRNASPSPGAEFRTTIQHEAGKCFTDQANSPAAGSPNSPDSSDYGRYQVRERLGAGAFGIVYRGWDPQLQRDVAIKVAKRERIGSAADAQRFLEEARTMAGVDHPGVISVFDCGHTEDGECFIVSKLVVGADLRAESTRRRFAPAEAARLVAAVAEALQAVHRRGVIHRDIKPENILLDSAGRPLVGDFGLALAPQAFGTGAEFCGTIAYMSPEQAQGRADKVDARSDIYSLGVILYELAVGQRPYRSSSTADLLREIADEQTPVRPPRQLGDDLPAELERIILKALAKRQTDRYTTAIDLARDLRESLGDAPRQRVVGRRPWMVAGGAGLALVLLVSPMWLRPTPPAAAGAAEPTRIEAFEIQQLTLEDDGSHVRRGLLRIAPRVLREGDGLQLRGRLTRPAYCYILAFRPDGGEDLCFPQNANDAPPLTDEPVYPWAEREREDTFYGFQEGPGWLALVLVVSEQPLPPYAQWRRERGPTPWRSRSAALGATVLRHDGQWEESIGGQYQPRGVGDEYQSENAGLPELIRWVKTDQNVVAVEAWAIPIAAR